MNSKLASENAESIFADFAQTHMVVWNIQDAAT